MRDRKLHMEASKGKEVTKLRRDGYDIEDGNWSRMQLAPASTRSWRFVKDDMFASARERAR